MIDFFFKLGVVFIGLAAFLLAMIIVIMLGVSVAMMIDDWLHRLRMRALQRNHDLRIEK